MIKRTFKLPPDASVGQFRQCELIRYSFLKQQGLFVLVRGTSANYSVPSRFDNPDRGYSVWWKILNGCKAELNPLVVLRYAGQHAITFNKPIDPASLPDRDMMHTYFQYQEEMRRSRESEIGTTLTCLTEKLIAITTMHSFLPETAFEMVCDEQQLDPVLEFYWRYRGRQRGVFSQDAASGLHREATLFYAEMPDIYDRLIADRGWFEEVELLPLFGGSDARSGVSKSTIPNGRVVAFQTAFQRFCELDRSS